jgi:hypothetical protein
MPRHRLLAPSVPPGLAALLGVALLALPAGAQQFGGPRLPQPQLMQVTPCGGRLGTTVEITVAGQDLDGTHALLFSPPGITAEPLGGAAPIPASPRQPQRPRRRPGARPTSAARFRVTIPDGLAVGCYDVRVVSRHGVSNPRAFVVGDLVECAEKEPNNDVGQAQRVPLNCTVNGLISNPTDVDYFVFAGKKGQRVVLSCLASTIDSLLHPEVELYDADGKLLGENRQYADADALLDCTLPADGDYSVRLCNYTYMRGGPQYYYRLSISTAPWIDAVFPPVVEPGKPNRLTVYGRNLPGGRLDADAVVDGRILEKLTVTVEPPRSAAARHRLSYSGRIGPAAAALDGFEYRLHNSAGTSNPFPLTYATAPVVLDGPDHDQADHAQHVPVPCEIAGCIEKRGDRDWYAFTARRGQVYSIEVFGDRLGFPGDLYFLVRNARTKQLLGEFDDNQEVLSQAKFFTRSEDPPRYRFVAPADGTYQLMVSSRDAGSQFGPRSLYRVRVTPEQPDFHLIVMPPSATIPEGCVLRQGGNQYYDVFVWRQDGWNGPVELAVEGLPRGVRCPPQVIGPGLKQAALVLQASKDVEEWTGEIRVTGKAVIRGETVVREARPATLTYAAFPPGFPALSRLDRSLVLAVRGQAPFRLTAAADSVAVVQGGKGTVTVRLDRLWPDFKGPLQVLPAGTPPTFTLPPGVLVNGNRPFNMSGGKGTATLNVDVRVNAAPGTYNLVLVGQGQVPFAADPKAKNKQNVNVTQPSTPVRLTVLPRQLARLSLSGTPSLRAGKQTTVLVRIARLYDFAGDFKVRLVLPPQLHGIEGGEVVIPAGKNEARLQVRAAPDAAPGSRSGVIVRATAMFEGKVPVTQDAKLNINVVK